MRALVVAALDEQVAEARRSHFSEGDLLLAHAPLLSPPGAGAIAMPLTRFPVDGHFARPESLIAHRRPYRAATRAYYYSSLFSFRFPQ
jgi:hypothetical protein